MFSHVQLFATPQTVVHWASLSIGLSRQEYWNGLPFPTPGDLPNPGIELTPPALQADSLPLSHLGTPHFLIRSAKEKQKDSDALPTFALLLCVL